jgi:glutamate transport system substrate-binding protein
LFAIVLGMALVSAACGGDDDDGGADGPGTAIPAPTFSPDSTMGQLAARGRLVVGVKFDQPGFGFKDPVTGNVDGFDVALGREIGRALGLEADQIEFVEAVTAQRIALLQGGDVDIVIATMTITDERRQQVDFSRPYYVAGQSILVLAENEDIEGVDDLDGRRVCSVEGSTSAANLERSAPRAERVLREAYTHCVAELKDGSVDAVTTDDSILLQFVARDRTMKIVGDTFSEEPYGIGVAKGQEDLIVFLDAILDDMLEDGRWDSLYEQHIGSVPGFPTAEAAKERLKNGDD